MYPPPHMICMYPPPHVTCMYPDATAGMYPPPHMTCMYPPPLHVSRCYRRHVSSSSYDLHECSMPDINGKPQGVEAGSLKHTRAEANSRPQERETLKKTAAQSGKWSQKNLAPIKVER